MDVTQVAATNSTAGQRRQELTEGLERAFLSEMLKYTRAQDGAGAFGGGIGESQFSSMLNDAFADLMVQKIDLHLLPEKGSAR